MTRLAAAIRGGPEIVDTLLTNYWGRYWSLVDSSGCFISRVGWAGRFAWQP